MMSGSGCPAVPMLALMSASSMSAGSSAPSLACWASLRAAGWKCIGQAGGLRWTGKRKPTVDLYPAQMKVRYQREVIG